MSKYSKNLLNEINQIAASASTDAVGALLSDTLITQLQSVMKRLNERKRVYEREGATHALGYKNLESTFANMPNYIQSKGAYKGGIYLHQGQKGVNDIKNMDIYQIRRLLAVNANVNTNLGENIKQARAVAAKLGLPTDRQSLIGLVNEEGDLHDFIQNHTEAYYNTRPDLKAAVQRSGQLTEDEPPKCERLCISINTISTAREIRPIIG